MFSSLFKAILKPFWGYERSLIYEKTLARLQKTGDAPFTLGAEAVLEAFLMAIEAKKPKARYAVTFPTKLFAWLKRFFSTKLMDYVARKSSE